MITESDGKCMINPPPELCSRCGTMGTTIIGWNQVQETLVDIPYMKYYEIFYKCTYCGLKQWMPSNELVTFNSYKPEDRVWPKAMRVESRKGVHVS